LALKIIPVAVSGGAGTRLWPLSTWDKPKQFHAIGSDKSLLQETVLRLGHSEGFALEPPLLVCNARHAALARRQLEDVGRSPSAVIVEPFGRNTAAVAMAASLAAQALDPEALVLLAPSDHTMSRPDAFSRAIAEAAPMARERFVLFGVVPTAPETGYGYIETGALLSGRLSEVARFKEKPDAPTAEAYLRDGRHFWNAGIFLFAPGLMIEEMERLAPQVAEATRAAMNRAKREGDIIALDPEAFEACPSISIDYAVMEPTNRAAVIPMDAGWTDVGSWGAVWAQGARDGDDNLVRGDVELVDCEGCLVWSGGRTVTGIGLQDLIIVQTEDAVMVAPKARAQEIRRLAERMAARGKP
jgi:mannose-1-phosphate guanylyltransferase/mannose-6-phosphate isomerase